MPVIRAERDRRVRAALCPAPRLFFQQHAAHANHIGIPTQMLRFLEGPVGLFAHIAQVGEMDAGGMLATDGGGIVPDGTPVEIDEVPVPSRTTVTVTDVSAVVREVVAVRVMGAPVGSMRRGRGR